MEMGSSSSPSDSLNGLKFGQKIYFEDVGGGSSSSSATAAGSGGQLPPTPPKKGRSGVFQGGQPPRCQVEGCKVDLSDAKAYYSRHKVCGMHSKSPKVIVAGLEQRFCQQCSRFHQLPEFDQGKRSCRRRLAGHNERRRKPPPGSLLSSRFGRLSSSVLETGRGGSFLMDFSTYPRFTASDPWQVTRASDRVSSNQPPATGKFLPHLWPSEPENPPSNLFLHSVGGNGYSGSAIPSGECFAGVSDSGCALSLLSNQPWGSRNRPSNLEVSNFLNGHGAPMVQSTAPHGSAVDHFSSTSWSFKGTEAGGGGSHEMAPDLGLRRIPLPPSNQFAGEGELELSQLEHSRAYNSSTPHMHWSL